MSRRLQFSQKLFMNIAESAIAHDDYMITGACRRNDRPDQHIDIVKALRFCTERLQGAGYVPVKSVGITEHQIGACQTGT